MMKKLILGLFIASSSGAVAQHKGDPSGDKIRPVVGIHWTGGLSYAMEQELPSIEAGLIKYFDSEKTALQLSGVVYLDVAPEKSQNEMRSFYNVKLQAGREIIPDFKILAQAGYINAWDGDLMRGYSGAHKSHLSLGAGFVYTFDEIINAEIMYEHLAGYPHLSLGVIFKL